MHSSHINFDVCNVDKRTQCMHCNIKRASYHWTCECNKPWYTCQVHCRVNPPRHKLRNKCLTAKIPRKRAITKVSSFDELLAQDICHERRSKSRRTASNLNVDSAEQNRDIVQRMKFGPKITALLGKLQRGGAPQACFKHSSSGSSSV